MKQRLLGKKAAVTGASSGIGRASAVNLAKEGADVALIPEIPHDINKVVEKINERNQAKKTAGYGSLY
mgnify:CR=1 FL=1